MNILRRIAYLAYYVRQLDWALLDRFQACVKRDKGWSKSLQWRSILRDSLRFNISPLEFYQFRFFEIEDADKAAWAGTGTMYEFQRRANPPTSRGILSDKRRFYRAYERFFLHELYSLEELQDDPDLAARLLVEHEKLVLKEAIGNCGEGVRIVPVAGLQPADLVACMDEGGFDLVETFVQQHEALHLLSPSAVNTVRVFTQIRSSGEYEVLGCRLRISINSPVDNLAAGNMAAPIDASTGIVDGPGVFSDVTRNPQDIHPVTGIPIVGLQIPFWDEVMLLVKEASLLHPENRSVGWDVVITNDGPGLIEGNHDWCKLVWQLPVRRGLKHRLDLSA